MSVTFFVVFLIAVLFVIVGLFHRKSDLESEKELLYVPFISLFASLFVVIGAGEYAISANNVVKYGALGLSFLVALAASFFCIMIYVPKIFDIKSKSTYSLTYDKYESFTTPDYLSTVYGTLPSILATIISFLAFFTIYILQIYVGGKLLASATNVEDVTATLLIAITTTLYTVLGGFPALYRTDVVQGAFMWLGLIFAVIWVLPQITFDSFSNIIHTTSNTFLNIFVDDPDVLTIFILTLTAAFSGPDLWQRINMAEKEDIAKLSLKSAGYGVLIFTVLFFVMGIEVNQHYLAATDKPADPFLWYFEEIMPNSWPNLLVAFFAIGLVAAFVSTADTSLMLAVTSLQNEIFRLCKKKHPPKGENKKIIVSLRDRTTNILLILLSIIALYFALQAPKVSEQFLIVLGFLSVMGVPVLASLRGRGTTTSVSIALFLGMSATVILGYLIPQYNNGWFLLIPVLLSLVAFLGKQKDYH